MQAIPYNDTFQLNSFDINESWRKLEIVFNSILCPSHATKITSAEWTSAFAEVYRFTMGTGDKPSLEFAIRFHRYFSEYVNSVYKELYDAHASEFEVVYNDKWEHFNQSMNYVSNLVRFYDTQIQKFELDMAQSYLDQDKGKLIQSRKIMLDTWYRQIVSLFKERLRDIFSTSINQFYDDSSRTENIRTIRNISHSILLYSEKENVLIEELINNRITAFVNFRIEEATRHLSQLHEFPRYLEFLDVFISKLFTIVDNIFPVRTDTSDELITSISYIISSDTIEKCLRYFQENFVSSDTSRICSTIVRISEKHDLMKSSLTQSFHSFVETSFNKILIQHANMTPDLVLKISDQYYSYVTLINEKFFQSQNFHQALELALVKITKTLENNKTFSPFLSSHLDFVLFNDKRKKARDTDEYVKFIFKLYTNIDDKESFNKSMLKCISYRIINESINPNDKIFELFQIHMTPDYKISFNRMLSDHRNVTDLWNEYKSKFQIAKRHEPMINFNILRIYLWPFIHSELTIQLPKIITDEFEKFKNFYLNKHTSRKLELLSDEGSGLIHYSINNKIYKFHINSCQLAIFYHFNNADSLTLSWLSSTTNIPEELIIHHMIPFIDFEIVSLRDQTYSINPDFSYDKESIKLNISLHRNLGDFRNIRSKQPESASKDQSAAIQCAIMSTLKRDRSVDFLDLISQLKQGNVYKLDFQDEIVLKQLENLVERDFLSFDANGTKLYTFND